MSFSSNRRTPGLRAFGCTVFPGTLAFLPRRAVAQSAYRLAPEKLAEAVRLGHIRTALHFGLELWLIGALVLLLRLGVCAALAERIRRLTPRVWLQFVLFSFSLILLLYCVVELPITALGHWAMLAYRISIQSWPSWLRDQAMMLGFLVAIGVPVLVFAEWLTRWSPRRYWLWFWVASIPLILLGALVLPAIIEPIFDHFEPLALTHPELVNQLEHVVARTGTSIPAERMFLMRASEKGNGLNAYVTGLGPTRRIVVWDTTADRIPRDEILFIFAHESGHYVLHHVALGIALGIVGTLTLLWLTAQLAEWLVKRYGRQWKVGSLASPSGIVVLLLALFIFEAITEPVGNSISRAIEHQADVYGQEAIHGIVADPQSTAVSTFNHLGEAWLEDPNPGAFVEFWTYDHPSTKSRADFAARYNPWAAGGHPRYFQK
uniref:Putative membrane metalloprotease n=1 Tax=mine drainage metagenome TaxID=410659 RepID=E6PZQ7_9ZZZZ